MGNLTLKAKGSSPSAVVDECKRKLGLHVPMSLCSLGDDSVDLMNVGIEEHMVLVPVFPKGTEVRAINMVNNPDLNGKEGRVILERDGKYGIQFTDGKKGYMAGSNLAAIDHKAEAAKEALAKLMEDTRLTGDEVYVPPPAPTGPVLSRDEKRVFIQQVQELLPGSSVKDAGSALLANLWDVEAAVAQLEAEKKVVVPVKMCLLTDIAEGGSDRTTTRRVEKDFSVGAKGGGGTVTYACRKCRATLCTSGDVKPHDPDPSSAGKKEFKKKNGLDRISFQECGSVFLEEGRVEWIEPQLGGEMKGDLHCPKPGCKAKVGTYSWTGQQCSCGHWVCPALQLQQSKMDRFSS
eukprot:TRINITY_DN7985_c1_g1_i1.p1 TRINITY_DN7985_c1_g1~~TRINITY_DN7985_c1_g1_i1.p1  ORF type:complete len:401 (+),score=158.96 TRINITY_DN7985_c1_g1_i1:157-1203(+)